MREWTIKVETVAGIGDEVLLLGVDNEIRKTDALGPVVSIVEGRRLAATFQLEARTASGAATLGSELFVAAIERASRETFPAGDIAYVNVRAAAEELAPAES